MGEVREVTVKVPREHVPHVRDDLIIKLGSAGDALERMIGNYHDPSAPPLKLNGAEPVSPNHVHGALLRLRDSERLVDQLGWDPSEDADRELTASYGFLYKLALEGIMTAGDSVNNRAGHYLDDPLNRERLRWYHREAQAFIAIVDQLEELVQEAAS